MNLEKYYSILSGRMEEYRLDEKDFDVLTSHKLYEFFCEKYRHMDIHCRNRATHASIDFNKRLRDLSVITRAFEKADIGYRVLKGVAMAACYEKPYTRTIQDYDFFIVEEDIEEAVKCLCEMGYVENKGRPRYKEITLEHPKWLTVELHSALFRKEESFCQELTSDVIGRYEILQIDGVKLIVPNVRDHFRYMILHMMKHIKEGGVGLRHLLDFVFFTQVHAIDLASEYAYFEQIGHSRFYSAIISFCHYRLDMTVGTFGSLYDSNDELISVLEEYIVNSGVFGEGADVTLISQYYSNSEGLGSALVPEKMLLSERYGYAKRMQLLLPIAWLHRFLRVIFNRAFKTNIWIAYKFRKERYYEEVEYLLETLGIHE